MITGFRRTFMRPLMPVVLLIGGQLIANPILVEIRPLAPDDLTIWPRVIIFGIALLMEAGILWAFLRKSVGLEPGKCFKSFLLVHLVSYPVTLLLAGPLGFYAEAFPIAFESWLFPKVAKIPTRPAIVPVIISNIISFALGLLMPYLWIRVLPSWH